MDGAFHHLPFINDTQCSIHIMNNDMIKIQTPMRWLAATDGMTNFEQFHRQKIAIINGNRIISFTNNRKFRIN